MQTQRAKAWITAAGAALIGVLFAVLIAACGDDSSYSDETPNNNSNPVVGSLIPVGEDTIASVEHTMSSGEHCLILQKRLGASEAVSLAVWCNPFTESVLQELKDASPEG